MTNHTDPRPTPTAIADGRVARKYREHRANGYGASLALSLARHAAKPAKYDPAYGAPDTVRLSDVLAVRVSFDYDPHGFDPSDYMGEVEYTRDPYTGRESYTYSPAYTLAERVADNRRRGMARNVAHVEACRAIADEADDVIGDYHGSHYSSYVVHVEVIAAGEVIGEDYLGGVDVHDYRDDVARVMSDMVDDHDMVAEAVRDARTTLAARADSFADVIAGLDSIADGFAE